MVAECNAFVLREHEIEIENVSLSLLAMKRRATETERETDASLRDIWHTHTFTEIFVCMRGTLEIDSECGTFSLGVGDIAVIPPDYHHTMKYQNFEASKTDMTSLGAMLTRKKHSTEHDLYTPLHSLLSLRGITVYRHCEALSSELYTLSELRDREVSLATLMRFPSVLLQLAEAEQESIGEREAQRARHVVHTDIDMTRIALIEEIINLRYLEDFSADALAEMVHVSRRQLDRIVTARYGTSLGTVINHRRLRYAERLIKDTDRTLEEIRIAACYSSASAFNRAFRELYGITPSEYRRKADASRDQI